MSYFAANEEDDLTFYDVNLFQNQSAMDGDQSKQNANVSQLTCSFGTMSTQVSTDGTGIHGQNGKRDNKK